MMKKDPAGVKGNRRGGKQSMAMASEGEAVPVTGTVASAPSVAARPVKAGNTKALQRRRRLGCRRRRLAIRAYSLPEDP
jgi:hypothetical protein